MVGRKVGQEKQHYPRLASRFIAREQTRFKVKESRFSWLELAWKEGNWKVSQPSTGLKSSVQKVQKKKK